MYIHHTLLLSRTQKGICIGEKVVIPITNQNSLNNSVLFLYSSRYAIVCLANPDYHRNL